MTDAEVRASAGRFAKVAVTAAYAVAALTLVVLAAAPVSEPVRGWIATGLDLAAAVAAAAVCAFVAQRVTGRDRRTFATLTLSMACWSLGCAARAMYEAVLGHGAPTPSLEDAGYLLAIAALVPVVMTIGNPAHAGRLRRMRAALDWLSLMTIASAISFVTFLRPLGIFSPTAEAARSIVLAVFVSAAAALVLYPLVFRSDPWVAWAAFVVASVGVGALVVQASVVAMGLKLYRVGGPATTYIDAVFVTAFGLVTAAGVWRLSAQPATSAGPAPTEELPAWPGIVVSAATLLGIPLAIAVVVMTSDAMTKYFLGGAAALLAVLIISRNLGVVLEARSAAGSGAAEARYQTLVEGAPTAILVVGVEGTVLYANGTAARLLEAPTPYDLIGTSVADLLPTRGAALKAQAETESLIEGLMQHRGRPQPAAPLRRTRVRSFGGRLIDVERTASAIMYDGVPAVLIQGEDVTARVLAEQEAADYHQRLRALASDLVATEERERRRLAVALHDRVGQALAVSRMRLGSARSEGLAEGEDVDTAVEMIEDAIRETRALTTELAPPALYELGLLHALELLCEDFSRAHDLEFTVQGEGGSEHIDDERRAVLYRATRELMMNAVKHSGGRRVEVRLVSGPGEAAVTVSDDG
ncbi:MAG: PAS domain S-box protein, partial [Actinobacteria bacterium]